MWLRIANGEGREAAGAHGLRPMRVVMRQPAATGGNADADADSALGRDSKDGGV